jgi:predicted PurR-regulated permease PerM
MNSRENAVEQTTAAGKNAVADIGTAETTLSQETVKSLGRELFFCCLRVGACLIALWLTVKALPILILIILSLMMVATFSPTVRRMQKRISRGSAISIIVVSTIALIAVLLVIMIPPLVKQAQNLLTNLPDYMKQIETVARQYGLPLKLRGSTLDLSKQAASLGPGAWTVIASILSGITGILTVAVLTTYLLIDGPRVASSALSLLPRGQRLLLRQMFGEIGEQVGHYMRGQLITSAAAGIFSYIVLWLVKAPEPLALGFLAAASDAVPIVGFFVGTIPAVLMAMTVSPNAAIIVAVTYILYHQFESHILVPRIYGKMMKMSPSIIIISLLVGAVLMGILGALLALPTANGVNEKMSGIQRRSVHCRANFG